MKLYYIANARLPNEKAHGIQIAKTCEAFAKLGMAVTLVVPSRKNDTASFEEFYGLQARIPVKTIRVPDLYLWGPIGFAVSSLFFMLGYASYLRKEKQKNPDAFAYSIDMDTYSFIALAFSSMPYAAEMHGIKKHGLLRNYFFKHAKGIIAINAEVKRSLLGAFNLASGHVLVEPNGVDVPLFSFSGTKAEARQKLGLSEEAKIALYVGRMYAWKGLEILAEAAKAAGGISWYVVGARKEDFTRATGYAHVTPNLVFAGEKRPQELAPWCAAADALVIVGTKRNEDSYRYTAPMKLFEYLAAERPLVVCDTPALRSIAKHVPGISWYEPDNAGDLAARVEASAAIDTSGMHDEAVRHSWDARAKRIRDFLQL